MMEENQTAFQIETVDNVATALNEIKPGSVVLRGDRSASEVIAVEGIPVGHKIALRNISAGEKIIKYGVVIGRATTVITKGSWVHLHCVCSVYDERSAHLDLVTGAPTDTKYE
jgi:altronate dehydratase